MAASAAIGALVGGGDERAVAAFRDAGRLLGLAFQVRDDALGIWGDPKDTGKATGEDIRSRKKTYPIVHTMESASAADRARLRELYAAPRLKRETFDEIVAILERARARDEAEAVAIQYAEEALGALEGLNLRDGPLSDLAAMAAHFARRAR
jgi:geranylgeranyl diphosphate synthase type I